MTPNFFDHVRELRAKMLAGTLTPDQAAQELADRDLGNLNAAGAATWLADPVEDSIADLDEIISTAQRMLKEIEEASDD